MIRLELSDQQLTDIAEALDDPELSDKLKTKLLVLRMHHEGAEHGFIAKVLNLHANTITNYLKQYRRAVWLGHWKIVTTGLVVPWSLSLTV